MSSFLSYLFGGSTDQNAAGKEIGEKGAPLMQDADHPGVTAFQKLVRDSGMAEFNKTGKEAKRLASNKTGSVVNPFSLSTEVMETEQSRSNVAKHIKEIITKAEQNACDKSPGDYELLADAFILCAHKRGTTRGESGKVKGVAGGEGERLLYYQMVLELYKYYPETTIKLIGLTPEFGYWLDLYQIWALLCWRLENSYEMLSGPGYNYNTLVLAIIRIIYEQLVKDLATPDSDAGAMPSTLVKWFAREGSYYDKHCYLPGTHPRVTSATIFARLVGHFYFDKAKMPGLDVDYIGYVLVDRFTPSGHLLNKYRRLLRKRVADLNRKAKTFETFACAGNWSSINPASVPSRCMLKNTKAYLNESLKGSVSLAQEETGNRYPENPDRVQARKNLLAMLTEPSKIKTAGVDPHEIMNAFVKNESVAQSKVAMAQWTQKVAEVMAQLAEKRAELDVPAHVGKLIPMMDVSGSMSGLPMEVSIGLGIFLTYIQEAQGQEPVAISFNEAPRVFDFKGMTLRERYDHVNANVGLTTNFESALDLVLDCIAKSGEHRDLIVFTDGQFDQMNVTDGQFDQMNVADGRGKLSISWTTSHERFLQKVAERGLDRAPRIIYWNLRANTPGVQTSATHPGVQMLQGYSPALLRFVLLGDNVPDKEVEVLNTVTGKVEKVKVASVTPYETYRAALDVERWDIVRAMLDESTEKFLAGYKWVKAIADDTSETRI